MLVIPATPSLLDTDGYTQSKTSNTLDTEVNYQIKTQNATTYKQKPTTKRSNRKSTQIESMSEGKKCLGTSW